MVVVTLTLRERARASVQMDLEGVCTMQAEELEGGARLGVEGELEGGVVENGWQPLTIGRGRQQRPF
jgi:hypothetical protein